ncbi:MAG: nucleoside triphosphate pyrophosphohydrolase [Treponemataceae bacterium]|nr:MAG: nucleoside triphosphate pyrophosphohydrolase [Treponemataceae bacterium]
MGSLEQAEQSFARFFAVIQRLRGPGGCPWDIEQTPLSMRDDLIEEAFEAAEAVSERDAAHVKEELGDVLLNTFIIAYMHEQAGDFAVSDMLDALSQKLIRRHPHVFSESEANEYLKETARAGKDALSPDEVLAQWDAIKAGVENRKSESVLDEVSAGFPPLLKALKLQKKAAKKSFDWRNEGEVRAKVREEFDEVLEAMEAVKAQGDGEPFTAAAPDALNTAQLALEEETGDLLFAVVNWARHLRVDPVIALSRANNKFSARFRAIERAIESEGKDMKSLSLEELDVYWERAKIQCAG